MQSESSPSGSVRDAFLFFNFFFNLAAIQFSAYFLPTGLLFPCVVLVHVGLLPIFYSFHSYKRVCPLSLTLGSAMC